MWPIVVRIMCLGTSAGVCGAGKILEESGSNADLIDSIIHGNILAYQELRGEGDGIGGGLVGAHDVFAAASAVAKVTFSDDDRSGSGFLATFKIEAISWEQDVFVTNHHVISNASEARGARAVFHYERGKIPVEVGFLPDVFFLSNEDLDFTFVALQQEKIGDVTPILLGKGHLAKKGTAIEIWQHPARGWKRRAIQTISDVWDDFVLYMADTDYGSSGSPVFQEQGGRLHVLALHHERELEHNANKGVLMDSILKRAEVLFIVDKMCPDHARLAAGLIRGSRKCNLQVTLIRYMALVSPDFCFDRIRNKAEVVASRVWYSTAVDAGVVEAIVEAMRFYNDDQDIQMMCLLLLKGLLRGMGKSTSTHEEWINDWLQSQVYSEFVEFNVAGSVMRVFEAFPGMPDDLADYACFLLSLVVVSDRVGRVASFWRRRCSAKAEL